MDEIRARMSQMEKSMKWWNDCSNNWRQKWTEVRNEKNRLKEECRNLKSKLEDVESECIGYKNELIKLQNERIPQTCVYEQRFDRNLFESKENVSDTCNQFDMNDIIQKIETLEFELNEAKADYSSIFQEREELLQLVKELQKQQKGERVSNDVSTDTYDLNIGSNLLEAEISKKCKELNDLKHAHNQLKKVLQEKCIELANVLRKNDAYENEIKKLRLKTDELKKELVVAEDEVDNASSTIRKLQRTNNKLQEQVNGLQVKRNDITSSDADVFQY
ncbi:coiled-coil domain-containing protein 102A-like isoform X2 [Dinothrombium tinctorium]|uniref:Coiled-coil domain-containing protein 102A-like isoform X2 n=1 Tax=Dinothrombium tinctorium TaxID=1965070 RepID=A0A3S3QIE6_9ACAR|nr:coiled-coil domain-containing protein 102A-like isoform X2 [Dinothrombium tinctorium]